MSYQLGDDPAPETQDAVLARIDTRTAEIQQFVKDESRRRTWTVILSVAGAVLAAIKLGIVAVPVIRRRRAHAVGELADNPGRRRHRVRGRRLRRRGRWAPDRR